MSRLVLLLIALCLVKVLATSRTKREVAKDAVLERDTGGISGNRGARVARSANNKKYRSTSSSSGEKDLKKADDDGKDSIQMTISDSSASGEKKANKNKYVPKSTEERHGWRKWHRKCQKCPEDQRKKWRDPTIKWICGAYQRAHRSFKSECMMYYRNCQDGTMFVKIHDHRCENSSSKDPQPRGYHFMYDYKVRLSDDSSESKDTGSSSSESKSSSSSA